LINRELWSRRRSYVSVLSERSRTTARRRKGAGFHRERHAKRALLPAIVEGRGSDLVVGTFFSVPTFVACSASPAAWRCSPRCVKGEPQARVCQRTWGSNETAPGMRGPGGGAPSD
jgi:hypothetical protein